MTRAIEFRKLEDALQRSADEAAARGCNGVTKYWWPVHEQGDKVFLLVKNDGVADPVVDIQIKDADTLDTNNHTTPQPPNT